MTTRPAPAQAAGVVRSTFAALAAADDIDDDLVLLAGVALLTLAQERDDAALTELLAPHPGDCAGLDWCVRRYASRRPDLVVTMAAGGPSEALRLMAEQGNGSDAAEVEVRDAAGVSWRPAERRDDTVLAAPPTGRAITGDDEGAVASARAAWAERLHAWHAQADDDADDLAGRHAPGDVAPPPPASAAGAADGHDLAPLLARLERAVEQLERGSSDPLGHQPPSRVPSATEIANAVVSAMPPSVTPAQLEAQFIGLPRPATEAHLRSFVLSAIENAALETQERIAERLDQARDRELSAIREEIRRALEAEPATPARVDEVQLSAALGWLRDEVARLLAGAPQLPTAADIVALVEQALADAVDRVDALSTALRVLVELRAEDRSEVQALREAVADLDRRIDALFAWTERVL